MPSEVTDWCTNGEPVPKTPRIISGLSRALEIPQAQLWAYLRGDDPIGDLPTTKAQMRAAIPEAWVKALFPLVPLAEDINITAVLRRLADKILASQPTPEPDDSD
jgi:hypothetical protein